MKGQSATPGKRSLRAFSIVEKINAIQRVKDGASKASVARDIGAPESTLRGWCKSEHKIRNMARNSDTPNSEAHFEDSSSYGNPQMIAGTSKLSSERLSWDYLSNLMSTISGTEPENSALLLEQFGIRPQNNNNNERFKRMNHPTDDDVSLTTYEEAIIHGEKFFQWLDNCSDPSVSRVQVKQLKDIVDGLKSSKMPSRVNKRSRK